MHDDMQLADKAMTQIHAAVEGLYDTLKESLRERDTVMFQRELQKKIHDFQIKTTWSIVDKNRYLSQMEYWLLNMAREKNDLP